MKSSTSERHLPLSSDTGLALDVLRPILQEQAWRQLRVVRMNTPQGQIVIKGQRPARGATRYRLLNITAKALKATFLKAAPAWGGERAQQVEVGRLRALAAKGLPVPAILHVDKEFFVMESLGGRDLAHAIISQPEYAYDYWHRGGELLLQVHAQHQYLSQAFARNFIVQGDKTGLIDFEDDPLEVMSLPEAQVRDWLAYLHSTAWLLPAHFGQISMQLDQWISLESLAVQAAMHRAAVRLSWMRHLPSSRKRWGRDIVSAQALGQLLHGWMKQRNLSIQ